MCCCVLKNVLLRRPVGTPARHQVAELPPTAVILSEHRLQRLRCPDCGATTRAELPPEVPPGAFGPRLQAAVVTLAVRNRVSRRDAAELVRELFGCRLASGTIDAIVQGAGAALEEPHARLRDHVRSAPAVNIDETGWRTAGERRTLWGVLSGQEALFRIAAGRHRREAQALLGEEFSGVACSDRWWAFRLPRPEATPALLGSPGARLHRPQRGPRRPEACLLYTSPSPRD